jgi:hypothetical protein
MVFPSAFHPECVEWRDEKMYTVFVCKSKHIIPQSDHVGLEMACRIFQIPVFGVAILHHEPHAVHAMIVQHFEIFFCL